MLVQRFDLARFSSQVERTPQGFIRAPANFTRVGVFVYRRADGTEVREFRPPEEVFHEDSLATLSGAPVVELHPKDGMVTPANAKKLSIGFAGETVSRKDAMVAGSVTVFDQVAIDKVASRDLSEISLGYNCTIDATPGEDPTHGRYDQIQRNIRYNHVALGPSDWGRAGSEVALRLDSQDAVQVVKCGDLANTLENKVSSKDRADSHRGKTMSKIKIAGVTYEVEDQVGQAFAAYEARNDEIAKELQASQEALQGRFDAAEAKVQELTTKVTELEDPARFDAAVKDRMDLEAKARSVLGAKAELPATAREIQEAVLKHDAKDLDLSGKSDEYVAARFDQRMENPPAAPKPGAARAAAHEAVRTDSGPDSDKARAKMLEDSANAWQKPLAISTRS